MLIIKLAGDIKIENDIGRIFRTHNIVEYKSPDDSMNEDTFLKVYGYACLYKAQEKNVNDIPLEDISITLVRKGYPRKLFGWMEAHSYEVIEQYPGIYYVYREDDFPIQIIVSKYLSKENQKWLTLLDGGLSKNDAQRAIVQSNELLKGYERAYADSLLQVVVKENEDVFDEIKKEDEKMCEALRKLMEPEFNEELEKRTKEVTKEVTEKVTKAVTEEVILRCLKKAYDYETISDISGATIQEIQAIAKDVN